LKGWYLKQEEFDSYHFRPKAYRNYGYQLVLMK